MSCRKSLIFVIIVFAFLLSCGRIVDISGIYKGKMIASIDSKNLEIGEIHIILNQKRKTISGSLTHPNGTMEIGSGVIEGNDVSFIAITKREGSQFNGL